MRCESGAMAQCDSSFTGVDRTPVDDPNKVWRCDSCSQTAPACERCDDDGYLPESTLSQPVYCPECEAGDAAWIKDHPSGGIHPSEQEASNDHG
jgi:rubrerythrin